MTIHFDQVIASYHRARSAPEFFDTFYETFLKKSAELPTFFSRTDFRHQKRMLREALLELLVYYQTGGGEDQIDRLGGRHRDLSVKHDHYALWLDALCEALAIHDAEFNASLEAAWREAMRPGIEIMTRDN
jgi:hemoglobin-like flavoprotein